MANTTRPRTALALTGAALLALAGCGKTAQNTSAAGGDAKAGDSPTAAAGTATDKVAVKNFSFQPATATVKVGSTVTFTFADDADHNVSFEEDKLPKTPDLKDGKSATTTFATAGTYKYYCGIHQYMTGTVIVQ